MFETPYEFYSQVAPPPPFPFIHEFHLAPQAEMRGGGEEKTRVNLAGISHHVASSLQA